MQDHFLARPLGVYRVRVVSWSVERSGHYRVRAFIWSKSGRRFTKTATVSYAHTPPRASEAEAQADWRKWWRRGADGMRLADRAAPD